MQGFWASCLSRFEKELLAQQFNTWIRPLKLDASAAPSGELRILAPNRFVLQWVKERFVPRIEAMGAEFFSSPIRVSLNLETASAAEPIKASASASAPAIRAARTLAPRSPHAERSSLIPEFSFDGFVAGKANQLARAAALQVAEHPGTSYNPLFIYGGVGLGKTHLIHAVGNLVLAQHPSARVRYLHAAQYISDVIRAHKQLIITCDTYPKDLAGMDERLKSRFSWGLTVAIEPPEQEMRVAIILKKAEAVSLKLSEEVAFFIAKHIRSNVRELEGALKSVIAYSRFNGRDITLDTAKEALKDLLTAQNRQITIDNIQKTVAEYYKIKVSDMHSKKRSRNVARPRQLAMALAKDLTQMSLPDIGDAFGNRDHTTVLHACRTIATLREKNHDINRDYHVLEQVLKG